MTGRLELEVGVGSVNPKAIPNVKENVARLYEFTRSTIQPTIVNIIAINDIVPIVLVDLAAILVKRLNGDLFFGSLFLVVAGNGNIGQVNLSAGNGDELSASSLEALAQLAITVADIELWLGRAL